MASVDFYAGSYNPDLKGLPVTQFTSNLDRCLKTKVAGKSLGAFKMQLICWGGVEPKQIPCNLTSLFKNAFMISIWSQNKKCFLQLEWHCFRKIRSTRLKDGRTHTNRCKFKTFIRIAII